MTFWFSFQPKPAGFVQQGDPKPTKPLGDETKRTLESIMISPLPPYLHLSPVVSMVTTLRPACQWSFLTPEGNLWPEGSWPGSRGQKWPEGNKKHFPDWLSTSPHFLFWGLSTGLVPQFCRWEDCSFPQIDGHLARSSVRHREHLITHYVRRMNASEHSCENRKRSIDHIPSAWMCGCVFVWNFLLRATVSALHHQAAYSFLSHLVLYQLKRNGNEVLLKTIMRLLPLPCIERTSFQMNPNPCDFYFFFFFFCA